MRREHVAWLSGAHYQGCSAEAAVLPLMRRVSSEHDRAFCALGFLVATEPKFLQL